MRDVADEFEVWAEKERSAPVADYDRYTMDFERVTPTIKEQEKETRKE